MRPQGRGELESLYFRYPRFSAKRAPELDGKTVSHPVVIVGAGPVGMTAALTLASYGIATVVIEKKNTFSDGSRAICVARPSFHILQQIGAVAPFLETALGWTAGRSYFRDREIYRFEMPHSDDEKYLPMYNIQQQYIEQYLWQACARNPLIDLRWESSAESISQDKDGVTLGIASPHGVYGLKARYLLAADGAHSAIRSALKLRLHGQNHEGNYVIADVRMNHDFPTERRAFFGSAGNPGGTVLIHKQPNNIWRIDYQLGPHESVEDAIGESAIRTRIRAILANIGHDKPWDLEWWSAYTANTLCLDQYKHGNIIFIGDSAHIVPIFGVRGLNNGLADAHNIGWKLAYVLKGRAGKKLLDSYTPERRGATLDVFANALKSTRFMTPPSKGWRLAREAVLSMALSQPFAAKFADPRQMQPYTYAESPITVPGHARGFAGGPPAGALMSNVRLPDGSHLLDHVGIGFTGVYFTEAAPSAANAAAFATMKATDPLFKLLVIGVKGANPAGAIGIDEDGAISAHYKAVNGTFYLLRPDLHIVGRWRRFNAGEALHALETALGRGGEP